MGGVQKIAVYKSVVKTGEPSVATKNEQKKSNLADSNLLH